MTNVHVIGSWYRLNPEIAPMDYQRLSSTGDLSPTSCYIYKGWRLVRCLFWNRDRRQTQKKRKDHTFLNKRVLGQASIGKQFWEKKHNFANHLATIDVFVLRIHFV